MFYRSLFYGNHKKNVFFQNYESFHSCFHILQILFCHQFHKFLNESLSINLKKIRGFFSEVVVANF